VLQDDRARARLLRRPGARAGAVLVALLVLFAALGPVLASHDPSASDFVRGATPDTHAPVGPSAEFWLGTDRLFRDQLARLAHGARLSLLIAFAATAIACVVGAAVGVVAGYYEGSRGVTIPWPAPAGAAIALAAALADRPAIAWAAALVSLALTAAGAAGAPRLGGGVRVNADVALMRLVDVGLSFPFLLLVMAVAATLDRTTVTSILAVLGLTGWLGTARIVRAKTMQVRALDFVTAARALGQTTPRILVRHVLPNVAGPLVAVATVSVAQMILAEAVLSYLGAGVAPPAPTWGRMLFEGQDYYATAPWLVAAPSAAIFAAVLGFHLLGEGLRDALDPREAR